MLITELRDAERYYIENNKLDTYPLSKINSSLEYYKLIKYTNEGSKFLQAINNTEKLKEHDVFKKIKTKENGNQTSIGHKESKDVLEEYFFDILPDYDEDRVYPSDIKKVIRWYNLLQKNNLLDLLDEEASDEEE